jgi:hypothetical protein
LLTLGSCLVERGADIGAPNDSCFTLLERDDVHTEQISVCHVTLSERGADVGAEMTTHLCWHPLANAHTENCQSDEGSMW